ncbi:MAG: aldehyde dehydrogenase family protein [Candidatus Omnitrophota bacterium]|nr:aldehyde dehydrogenase family protein [Candidatus Omnitrophota bacterium]
MSTDLFINGEFKEAKEKQNIINPSTGKAIAQAGVASLKDVDSAIAGARAAFDQGEWPRLSLAERKDFISKISQGILDNAGELAELESLNTGKPIKETTFMDIPSAAKTFEYAANNFERFLSSEELNVSGKAKAVLRREPVGVVVLIVPWNYPLLIACWKLASALAAGNTVILKPSSLTPLSALKLAGIAHTAGIPAGVVNVINGSGDKIGAALCADRRIDMLSFTGSNEVGRKILEYSSQNIKKSIMELGGKSASLIFNDADLDTAVNSSLVSIFLNQGQMCTAMSRIFVQDSLYDKFVVSFVEKARTIKLGPADSHETQMGPLISENQRKRVIAFVEKAKAEGAQVLCGGKIPQDPALKNGFFFEPTVIIDVKPQMTISKEEVFGPVVTISRFSNSDEAVKLANASDFGLAACIWSKDINFAERVACQLNSGTVWINTYGMFYNQLPYGGFKQSGFGKELGREGFLEYTRLKNIIIDQSADSRPLVNYWYGF